MAIGVQIDFRNVTLDQYDEVTERTGFLPGGPAVSGSLFHWATKTNDGIRIVDVWESRQAFDTFVTETGLPVFAAVGVVSPPEIQFYEVHNYLVGPH